MPSAESIPLGRESEGDAGHSEISLEDTESPECISTSTSGELKKRFLDRLAEVISYRKGGTHVSSTALDEKVDSISVYMARNDGFYDDDKEKLPVLLKLISDTRESMFATSSRVIY